MTCTMLPAPRWAIFIVRPMGGVGMWPTTIGGIQVLAGGSKHCCARGPDTATEKQKRSFCILSVTLLITLLVLLSYVGAGVYACVVEATRAGMAHFSEVTGLTMHVCYLNQHQMPLMITFISVLPSLLRGQRPLSQADCTHIVVRGVSRLNNAIISVMLPAACCHMLYRCRGLQCTPQGPQS